MGGQFKAVEHRLLQAHTLHRKLHLSRLERRHARLPLQPERPLAGGLERPLALQAALRQQLQSPLQGKGISSALAVGGKQGHQRRRHPRHSNCFEDAAS